jgi:hypothetical protein
MKFYLDFSRLSAVILSCFVISAGVVEAQQARSGAAATGSQKTRPSDILRVKNFAGLGSKDKLRTPEYKTDVSRGYKVAQLWQRLSLSYDTAPKWIDEIVVRYYAMSVIKEKGVKAYSIFKTSIRYVDIEAGTKHISVAYLHPRAVDRYGDVVAIAFEVLNKGAVIAEDSSIRGKGIPKDWWKNKTVTESQNVTVRDGYLLSKKDSPFALINIDDYEFAK